MLNYLFFQSIIQKNMDRLFEYLHRDSHNNTFLKIILSCLQGIGRFHSGGWA